MHAAAADLRVTLVQADTRWHDPAGNRALYGDLVRTVAGRTDLVLLPETFTSGFTNETLGNAEPMDGDTIRWLRALAAEVGAVVAGSVVVREGERHFNRLVWMRPDGSHASYDKRHLFRYANEHQRYTPGSQRLVVDLAGWRVCPMVCYDLRFPVFARNRFDATVAGDFDYDLLLYVANWPSPRHYAWQTLLRARDREPVLRHRRQPHRHRRQQPDLPRRQRGAGSAGTAAGRVRRAAAGGDHHAVGRGIARASRAVPVPPGRRRVHAGLMLEAPVAGAGRRP